MRLRLDVLCFRIIKCNNNILIFIASPIKIIIIIARCKQNVNCVVIISAMCCYDDIIIPSISDNVAIDMYTEDIYYISS